MEEIPYLTNIKAQRNIEYIKLCPKINYLTNIKGKIGHIKIEYLSKLKVKILQIT